MANTAGPGSPMRQRVIGYVRVSTKGQGQSGVGLESQRAAIAAVAGEMDWELIQIFEDVATAMGRTSVKDRGGLQQAMSSAKDNDAHILVFDWSRLSRDTGSLEDIAAKFPYPDRIISVLQGSTLVEAVAAGQHAYGQKMAEANRKATIEGMAKKRELGAVHGNPTIRDVQPGATAAASDKANDLTRQIADVLAELGCPKLTHHQLAEILNDRGITTRQNNTWNESRIRQKLVAVNALIADDSKKAGDAGYASNPNFGLF